MFIVASKKKLKKVIRITALILSFVLIIVYIYNVVYPFVLELASTKAKALTMETINGALVKIQANNSFSDKFYNYEKNSSGDVVLIVANTKSINQFYVLCQTEMQNSLSTLNSKEIDVKLGAFTGNSLFASLGPDVKVHMSLVATSESLFNSYFYNKGINQTIHRTILTITTTVNILIPIKSSDITIYTEFVIAEDIIVGRVPETYITGVKENNIYDLIP